MDSRDILLVVLGIGASAVIGALIEDPTIRALIFTVGALGIVAALAGLARLWWQKRVHLVIGNGPRMGFHDPADGRRRCWIRFRLFDGPVKDYKVTVDVWSKQPDGSYQQRTHTPLHLLLNKIDGERPTILHSEDHFGLFRNLSPEESEACGIPLGVPVLYVTDVLKRANYKGTIEVGTHELRITLSGSEKKKAHTFSVLLEWTGDWDTFTIKPKQQPRWPDRIIERQG